MSKIKIVGHASGSGILTIAAPNTNTDRTITIPDVTGTLLDSGSDLPAANLTGTIAIARITDGTITAAKVAADVATQAELDTVSTVASAALPKAGGTMTGTLTVNAAAVFNETGADVDFRVEASGQDKAIIVNGATGYVGINTTGMAQAPLHILKTAGADTIETLLLLDSNIDSAANGKGGSIVFQDIAAYANTAEISAARVGGGGSSEVKFKLRNTDIMALNSNGYVTTPNQPGFRAYSTIGNISNGAIVQYNVQDWGNGSHYSTGANRFTAPVSGKYAIHFSVKGINIGAVYARIKKNGTYYGPALEFDNDIGSAHTCMSFIGSMNLNDYIEVWSASNVKVDSADSFSVILIG